MAKDTAKVIWIIGGAAALIVAGIIVIPQVITWAQNKNGGGDEETDKGEEDGLGLPNIVPVVSEPKPADTPEQILAKSYNKARKALGLNAKVFTAYTSLTTNRNITGGGFAQGTKFRIKIWPTGLFATFYQPTNSKDWTFINKGRYYKGGDRLVLGIGRNKGLVIDENKPLLLNINKSVQS